MNSRNKSFHEKISWFSAIHKILSFYIKLFPNYSIIIAR